MKQGEQWTLEEQLCPWKLSKEIVDLNGVADSYFKWVHPWSRVFYKENKRKYIVVEWYHRSNRKVYPAYTVTELSFFVSDNIIGFHNWNGWYCKDDMDSPSNTKYYSTIIEACAYAYIKLLKESEEDRIEEALIEERGLM